jgi:hypothetical protein
MAKSKAPRHTSKPLTEKTFLPPLQKKIFLTLAKGDPKDISETVKAIKGHYKSVWNAFNQLEKKKLIKAVSSKKYQGKDYPRYWVSEDGAFIALCEGVKANSVIERALKIYPDRKDVHYLLESVSILGTEAFKVGYLALIRKGKLEQSDVLAMMVTQVMHGLSAEQLAKYNKMLQKYPDRQQKYEDFFKKMQSNLNELIEETLPKKKSDKKAL